MDELAKLKGAALAQPHTPEEPQKPSAFKLWLKGAARVLGFLLALIAIILAAVDVVRTVNPAILMHHTGLLGFLSNLYPVVPALVTGIAGFIFGFGSKVLSGSARRSAMTTAAILISLLAVILSAASFATTHIFPEGMIHTTTESTAPLNDSDELTQRVDWAFGGCDSGWANIDPARFPGVSYINVCASTSTLFVAYDSRKQATAYEGIMAGKSAAYIETSLGHKLPDNTFSALYGDQWLVVGPNEGVKRLKSIWGGDVSPINSSDNMDSDDDVTTGE